MTDAPNRNEAAKTDAAKNTQLSEKSNQNIQDTFLNAARKERLFVTIFLMGGAKLSGRIRSFDKYSVILESNHQEQLIFKHAISTVALSRPAQSHATAAEA